MPAGRFAYHEDVAGVMANVAVETCLAFLAAVAERVEREARARRVVVAGAAHMLNLEQPEEFRRIVAGFLGAPGSPQV